MEINTTKAHIAVAKAKKNGTLLIKDCELCGAHTNIEAHHEDYNKPLDVIFLCKYCHNKFHKNVRKIEYENMDLPKIEYFSKKDTKMVSMRMDKSVINEIDNVCKKHHLKKTRFVTYACRLLAQYLNTTEVVNK